MHPRWLKWKAIDTTLDWAPEYSYSWVVPLPLVARPEASVLIEVNLQDFVEFADSLAAPDLKQLALVFKKFVEKEKEKESHLAIAQARGLLGRAFENPSARGLRAKKAYGNTNARSLTGAEVAEKEANQAIAAERAAARAAQTRAELVHEASQQAEDCMQIDGLLDKRAGGNGNVELTAIGTKKARAARAVVETISQSSTQAEVCMQIDGHLGNPAGGYGVELAGLANAVSAETANIAPIEPLISQPPQRQLRRAIRGSQALDYAQLNAGVTKKKGRAVVARDAVEDRVVEAAPVAAAAAEETTEVVNTLPLPAAQPKKGVQQRERKKKEVRVSGRTQEAYMRQ